MADWVQSTNQQRQHVCLRPVWPVLLLSYWSFQLYIRSLLNWLVNCGCGERESSLVRAPDSLLKGCEFESRQERWEKFPLQSQLCVLTLIRCPFHPRVTAVARKRPRSFCQKCRWQVIPKHAYTLDRVGWLCRCPSIVWEPIRKRAHTQLVRKHSFTVDSARWATVD